MVSANSAYKGVSRMLATFARAWQQAGVLPGGAPGRLVLVCIGPGMLRLKPEVERTAASMQAAQNGTANAAHAGDSFQAAVHVLDGTDNSTERLGWYVAGDVHVLNSGGLWWYVLLRDATGLLAGGCLPLAAANVLCTTFSALPAARLHLIPIQSASPLVV